MGNPSDNTPMYVYMVWDLGRLGSSYGKRYPGRREEIKYRQIPWWEYKRISKGLNESDREVYRYMESLSDDEFERMLIAVELEGA